MIQWWSRQESFPRLPLSTLKIHQLQLIRGTRMAHEYEENPDGFYLFNDVDEYIDLVIRLCRTSPSRSSTGAFCFAVSQGIINSSGLGIEKL